jgi:hypothetical protein
MLLKLQKMIYIATCIVIAVIAIAVMLRALFLEVIRSFKKDVEEPNEEDNL